MNSCQKYFSTSWLAMAALLVGASPAWAQDADFAVLAYAAVTCTGGTIIGDVGTNQSPDDTPAGSVTQTDCPIDGNVHVGDAVAKQAFIGFVDTYAALEEVECTTTFTDTSLGNHTFTPGVYCFEAAVTETGAVWTLEGGSNGTWLFKIGTKDPGALTGTSFSVVMADGGDPCNVTWWVDAAASMASSDFLGTILAGAAITTSEGGTLNGDLFSKADVTIGGTTVTGCEGAFNPPKPPKQPKQRCDQGVGNGSEGCDPGNSNQDNFGSNPFTGSSRTNDELGGTPGKPGKKGGNK